MQKKQPSEQQIRALAVSFLPAIRAYYNTDEGREAYRKYLEENSEQQAEIKTVSLDVSEKEKEKAV